MEAHQKSPGTAGGREDGADLGEGVALEVLEDGDVEVQSLSLTEGPTKSADLEAGRTLTNENLTRGPQKNDGGKGPSSKGKLHEGDEEVADLEP